jgi:hypothetical protein
VREGDHAVHVREFIQCRTLEGIGDVLGHRGRAVHGGKDADVVARGDAAIGSHDSLEGRGLRRERRRLVGLAKSIVAREVADFQVVRMDVLAGRDRLRGESYDLAVAPHGLVGRDRARGHLVPGRDEFLADDALLQEVRAGFEVAAGDHDIVGGVQPQIKGRFSQHGFSLRLTSSHSEAKG